MVKIFVGNLSESVGPDRLRELFLEHISEVEECDVLKNYAFVHVPSEEDADLVIEKLDKYMLEGKELHVERSNSQLRKEPGMSDKCFTCGAEEHKTSQCPKNSNRKRNNSNISTTAQPESLLKKPRPLTLVAAAQRAAEHVGGIYGYHYQAQQQQPSSQFQQQQQNSCWGYTKAESSDVDPELPCPQNPELHMLYEQYHESRIRYFFYRQQLVKELRLQQQQQQQYPSFTPISAAAGGGGTGSSATIPPLVSRVDLTQLGRPPRGEQQQQFMPAFSTTSQQQSFIPFYSRTTGQMEPSGSILSNNNSNNTIPSILSNNSTNALGTSNISNNNDMCFNNYTAYPPRSAYVAAVNAEMDGGYGLPPSSSRPQPFISTTRQQQQPTPLASIQPFGYASAQQQQNKMRM